MSRIVTLHSSSGEVFLSNSTPGVVIEEVDGWDRSAPLDTKTVQRIGHGSVSASPRRKGRAYTVKGYISGLTEKQVYSEMSRVSGYLTDLMEGSIQVSSSGQPDKVAFVRLGGEILVDDTHAPYGWFRFSIPLYSDDPYRYGPARALRVSTPAADYGLDWPLFSNGDVLTWGSGADLTVSGQIVNDGNAAAWPTVTVYGDFPSGVSVGDGSGQTVTFAGIVTPQAPLVLDCAAHTATVGGEDRSHMLTGRGFFPVLPGGVLRPVLRAAGVGSGYADVQVRSTYI